MFEGSGIQYLVNMCQVHGIQGVSLRQLGEVSVQVYHSIEEAKMLSHKLTLVIVLVYLDAWVEWVRLVFKDKRM